MRGDIRTALAALRLLQGLNARQVDLGAWMAKRWRGRPMHRFTFGQIHAAFPDLPRRTLQEDIKRLVQHGLVDQRGARKGTTYGRPRPTRRRDMDGYA